MKVIFFEADTHKSTPVSGFEPNFSTQHKGHSGSEIFHIHRALNCNFRLGSFER